MYPQATPTQPSPLNPLAEYIIRRSTGIFGDFQMPACAQLIKTEGVKQGWAYQLTYSDVIRILRRYKEHVVFWNTAQQTVTNELALFDDALGNIGHMYPWDEILRWFNELPARRAAPNEPV